MEHNDKIKDLFSEKLGNFESSVRPELWSNIASQIGATTTVTTVTTGVSLFTKTIIGVSVAAALGGFGYFAWNNQHQQADKNDTQVIADKSASKENDAETSANTPKEKIQRKSNINNNSSINQSFVPLISDFVLPTTEDFIDLLIENKELPIPTIQLAETILPESVEEPKQENIGTQVNHSTESVDNYSNSTPLPETVKVDLELPNVFTPNNDGANDYFEIKSIGLTDFSLVVLDMNGKPVYQTTDPNFKWDGMNLSNEKVKDGNYLYYLTAKDAEGKMISKSQSLRITTER